jgi:hypothetical protein
MNRKENLMFWLAALFLFSVLLCSCSQEYYKTREGKAKQRYYNQLQFGADPSPVRKF